MINNCGDNKVGVRGRGGITRAKPDRKSERGRERWRERERGRCRANIQKTKIKVSIIPVCHVSPY